MTGPLGGVVRAAPWRAYAAFALDLVPVVALAALAVSIGIGRAPHVAAPWVPAALAVVVAVAEVVLFARSGRSLGGLILGLRTVDDLTAMPIGPRALLRQAPRALAGRGVLTADLRAGLDPAALRLVPVPLGRTADPTLAVNAEPGQPRLGQPSDVVRPSVGIVLETGERYEIHEALLIGRSPVDPSGQGRALLSWPDMSRRLTKTHLLLEWSGTVLWVTDLGGPAGTSLSTGGGASVPLTPAVRAAAYVGSVLECAGRRIKVVGGG